MSCSQSNDIESVTTSSSNATISIEEVIVSKNRYVSPSVENMLKFVPELINAINKKQIITKEEIDKAFSKLRASLHILPSKPDIRRIYEAHFQHMEVPAIFKKWIIRGAVRADSGVLVVTITLSPHKFSCKYDCFYCPQETDLKGVPTQPRSYLSTEPAMLRAISTRTSTDSYDFDIMGQFKNRIKAYKFNGCIKSNEKTAKKIEVILSGGTWESYPIEYREQVMNELYWTANTMNLDRPMKTLEEEITENETAEYRIIGLTLETRPDNITPENIKDYCRWGVTRMQIGVQQYNDVILKKINRKCYTKDTIAAIRLLKQAGFKVVVHLMPDLPGSSPEEDARMFSRALEDPDVRFDDLKVYPTAICKSPDSDRIVTSMIAKWYEKGTYVPYAEKNLTSLVDTIIDFKTKVHPWIRIQRIVRDIPSKSIESGYHKLSNLRQIIQDKMKHLGKTCNCIYCKEIGDKELDNLTPILVVRRYEASQGTEFHLSVEAHTMNLSQKISYWLDRFQNLGQWVVTGKWNYWPGCLDSYSGLFGFCRLRIDPKPGGDFLPVLHGCGLIREVHVYGFSLGVGKDAIGSQHRGYGQLLVKKAEEITALNGLKMTSVIAGVGTREYYKKYCGYHKDQTYMKKDIEPYNYHTIARISTILAVFVGGSLMMLRNRKS